MGFRIHGLLSKSAITDGTGSGGAIAVSLLSVMLSPIYCSSSRVKNGAVIRKYLLSMGMGMEVLPGRHFGPLYQLSWFLEKEKVDGSGLFNIMPPLQD